MLSEKKMVARMACLLALAGLLGGQSADLPNLPVAAKAITVIPGPAVRIKYHFVAVGKQVYHCENGTWGRNSTPQATLYDMNSNLKVRHGAGPSWTTLDGKSTIKALGPAAIHFAAPDGVSIDWLKLDAEPTSRTGEFRDISIIQRLFTGAGRAPNSSCEANQVFEAAYTAHYYFWIAK